LCDCGTAGAGFLGRGDGLLFPFAGHRLRPDFCPRLTLARIYRTLVARDCAPGHLRGNLDHRGQPPPASVAGWSYGLERSCGVHLFGMLGLVLGPILVAMAAGVLSVYQESAEGPAITAG